MELSVVVPTLNGREQLAPCLDAIDERAPDAEVVVVNGPSADGTTGMLRERDDVDLLLEVATRNRNIARNAGLAAASGDTVALVDDDLVIGDAWRETVGAAIADGADVVTGPTNRTLRAGMRTERPESTTVSGAEVSYFNGRNVAFTRAALRALDGFDESLETGSARDAAHRLAALGLSVDWEPEMSVRCEYSADGGHVDGDWRTQYHSLVYRLVKNYGVRPGVVRRIARRAVTDSSDTAVDLLRGERTPTAWLGIEREMIAGEVAGLKDGLLARLRDRSPRRNPYGISTRQDRAVERYEYDGR